MKPGAPVMLAGVRGELLRCLEEEETALDALMRIMQHNAASMRAAHARIRRLEGVAGSLAAYDGDPGQAQTTPAMESVEKKFEKWT